MILLNVLCVVISWKVASLYTYRSFYWWFNMAASALNGAMVARHFLA